MPDHAVRPVRQPEHGAARAADVAAGKVSRIGADLAAALQAAHSVGIVHRDVKPGNVLIAGDGSAKLTDFGISHAVGDVTLTSTGMVSGTPAYLAPEVARGGESGFAADVFSLGATLYACTEGTPPFGADANPMAVLHRVASGQMIPPRRSGSMTPLLLHMMASDPADRPIHVAGLPDTDLSAARGAGCAGAVAGTPCGTDDSGGQGRSFGCSAGRVDGRPRTRDRRTPRHCRAGAAAQR